MKTVFNFLFLNLITLIIFISCASNDEKVTNKIDKISNTNKILTVELFEINGFKKVKNYDVSSLPYASSAYYGWFKDDLSNPRDYELRFYVNHESALSSKKIIDEVIGKDAILATRDVTWKEGSSDRRVNRRGAGSGPGSAKAKYLYYLIYENVVILCEGLDEEESIKLCNLIINKLSN